MPLPQTAAELRSTGLAADQIRHRRDRGSLVALRRGVYLPGDAEPSGRHARHLIDVAAACRAYPGAAGAGVSAGLLHGLRLLRDPVRPVLVRPPAPGRRQVVRRDVELRLATLPAGDLTDVGGVPVTTAARTVVDLARYDAAAGIVAADSALQLARCTRAELAATLAPCRRWRGARAASEVVELANGLSESALESLGRLAMVRGGLPKPRLQVWVEGADGQLYRVDFLFEEEGTIGEADGMLKYRGNPGALVAEKLRQEALENAGFQVVRFTWWDLNDELRLVQRFLAAFQRAHRR